MEFNRGSVSVAAATLALLTFVACNESTGASDQSAAVGPSCTGGGAACLGIRFVSYVIDGKPVMDEQAASAVIEGTNRLWEHCGIQFQISDYETVDPSTYGLDPGAGVPAQTSKVRETFNDGRNLLVVTTGPWGTTKNAWTSMPGSPPYGAVFEAKVADDPQIMAHELGHYLGLDHVDDPSNNMSPIVYPNSSQLTEGQCEMARNTVQSHWQAMLLQ